LARIEFPDYVAPPKSRGRKLQTYEPLIGDPCYRYNKSVKEKFFKNTFLSYLFI